MAMRNGGHLLLMALLFCIYTLTNAGGFHIVDEVSLFATTESLALRGAVDTNAIAWTQFVNSPGEVLGAFGVDGQVYSKKGPAPSFAAVPWFWLWRQLTFQELGVPFVQVTLLWNGIITALTAALLWLTARGLGYSERAGASMGLLFGLCTIAWPYANHFFGEPLSALGLLVSFYALHQWRLSGRVRWVWLAGIGAAVALTTVAAHLLLVGILGLYWLLILRRQLHTQWSNVGWRVGRAQLWFIILRLLPFITPVVLAGLLLMAYNLLRFGHSLDTGYHFDAGEGFTAAWQTGLWGLLLSPYRGLFWHTPIFVATLLAFPLFARRHRLEALIIALLSLVLVGLYARWWMWWGGFAWGPRFLVPLTPFWVLPLAEFLVAQPGKVTVWVRLARAVTALLAVLSLTVQLLAVLVNYVNYEIALRERFPTDWNDPLAFGPPAQRLGEWPHSPVLGQFYLLREDLVANSDLAWLWPDGTVRWSVLWVGAIAISALAYLLLRWWRQKAPLAAVSAQRAERAVGPGGAMAYIASVTLPLLLLGVWTVQVRSNPRYGAQGSEYRAILQEICKHQNADPELSAIVTITPYSYQIPMNWLPTDCRRVPPLYGYAQNALEHAETADVLRQLVQRKTRLWFITAGLPPNAPENTVERWLADYTYKAHEEWYGDYRLVRYGTPALLVGSTVTSQSAHFWEESGSHIQLMTQRIPPHASAGTILPVEWSFQLLSPTQTDLRWFTQLLKSDGTVAAQLDIGPDQGYATFSHLPVHHPHTERLGLELPRDLPAAAYRLIVGLYNPAAEGAPRLRTQDGADFVELTQVQVLAP